MKTTIKSIEEQIKTFSNTPFSKVDAKRLLEEFYDVKMAGPALDLGKAAKNLSMYDKKGNIVGRNDLFRILRDAGVLMRNGCPYQSLVENGMFTVNVLLVEMGKLGEQLWPQPLVYPKGLKFLRQLLQKLGYRHIERDENGKIIRPKKSK